MSPSRRPSLSRVGTRAQWSKLNLEPLEDRRLLTTVISVTTPYDVIASDGLTSLREAVRAANITTDDVEIRLAEGTYYLSIQGAGEDDSSLTGDLDITDGGTIGGLYAGESMFHRVRDASKVALVHLVSHLRARGYTLFDIQQATAHTASLGAVEIDRQQYLGRLAGALSQNVTFGTWLEGSP